MDLALRRFPSHGQWVLLDFTWLLYMLYVGFTWTLQGLYIMFYLHGLHMGFTLALLGFTSALHLLSISFTWIPHVLCLVLRRFELRIIQ